jgi:hypothetical protein
MINKTRINLRGKTRSGKPTLKAIIVIEHSTMTTMKDRAEQAETISRIEPDKNGIIWLAVAGEKKVQVHIFKK